MASNKADAKSSAAVKSPASKSFTFIVEHLENFDDSDWCRLEYEHINYIATGRSAPLVAAGNAPTSNRFVVTNITAREAAQLQPLGSPPLQQPASATDKKSDAKTDSAAAPATATSASAPTGAVTPIPLTNGYICYTQSIKDIHTTLTPDPARVCVLDMRATSELAPSDFDVFDTFVFGGVLGDHPPKDRAKVLRTLGFTTRRLGPRQMTTDTAVLTCSLIVTQRTHHAALLPPLTAPPAVAAADGKTKPTAAAAATTATGTATATATATPAPSSEAIVTAATITPSSATAALAWEPRAELSYLTAPAVAPFVLTSIPWIDDPEIETGAQESTSLPFRYIELRKWRQRLAVLDKLRSLPAPAPAAAKPAAVEESTKYIVAEPDDGDPLIPAGMLQVLTNDLDLGLTMDDEDVRREMLTTGQAAVGDEFDFDGMLRSGKVPLDLSATAAAAADDKSNATVTGSVNVPLGRELDLDEAGMNELNMKMMNGMSLDEFDSVLKKLGLSQYGAGGGGSSGGGAAAAPTTAAAAATPAAAASSDSGTAAATSKK